MVDLTEIQSRKRFANVFLAIWVGVVVLISVTADLGQVKHLGSFISTLSTYDVYLHFLLMGLVGFFAALVGRKEVKFGHFSVVRLVLFVICLSVLEESTQLWRPQRGFSFYDMGANVSGMLFFGTIGRWVKKELYR